MTPFVNRLELKKAFEITKASQNPEQPRFKSNTNFPLRSNCLRINADGGGTRCSTYSETTITNSHSCSCRPLLSDKKNFRARSIISDPGDTKYRCVIPLFADIRAAGSKPISRPRLSCPCTRSPNNNAISLIFTGSFASAETRGSSHQHPIIS